jgi:GDP-L-fucose synthase
MLLNKFKNKNVLITGGTGFLGKNLTPLLRQAGADVVSTGRDYDLTDAARCEELFKLKRYDLIIHAAAFQGAGDFTIRFPADQFYKNNLIHTNTLNAWHKWQPQATMIGIGSTCSYPGNMPVLAESDYFTGPLHPSVETYGLTKCVMHQGIKAYKKQYGLRGTTVVFATLYGPHDEFDISRSHVVSALIQKFCDAVKDGKDEVEVWGDGTQTRELIYIDDQIDGLLMASEYEGDLINIGSGIETSIRDLAEMIKRLSGFEGRINYNTDRFVGVKRKVLNINEAKESFGWTVNNKMHSLEEGVMKTIIWYRENEQ